MSGKDAYNLLDSVMDIANKAIKLRNELITVILTEESEENKLDRIINLLLKYNNLDEDNQSEIKESLKDFFETKKIDECTQLLEFTTEQMKR